MTSLEILDKKTQLIKRNSDIISAAKTAVRELTEEENAEFEANALEIKNLEAAEVEIENELKITDNKNTNTKILRNTMKDNLLINALSNAYKAGQKEVKIENAFQVTGESGEGEDVVSVDLMNEVILPLREEYLFGRVGAQIRTGLVGNPQIPVYTGGSLTNPTNGHVAETGTASQYGGAFTNITFSPKRISAFATVSRQWLIQAVPAAQNAVIEDFSRQVWDQIEANLLSDTAASDIKPAGILRGLTAVEVANYAELCDMEADLREKKYKKVSFALSPRAEAKFKSTIMGTNATGMIMQNGRVDGLDTVVTSAIEPNQFLLGDFSQLVIAFWANPQIRFYDDFQLAKDGLVGIVIDAFYDAKLVRSDAIALGEVVAAAEEGGEGGEG